MCVIHYLGRYRVIVKKKPLKSIRNSYKCKISLCTSRCPIIILKICMNLSSPLLGYVGKIIDVLKLYVSA